nr:unnamed protein product [Callosobruchus chinensis]
MNQINILDNIDLTVRTFTNTIIEAAHSAIGKTKLVHKHNPVPWWNQDCEKVMKESKQALNQLRRHNTTENLVDLKLKRARVRLTVRKSQKESWRKYVSTINSSTPISKKPIDIKPPLFLSKVPLKYVDNIKFLGITFDERLTWKQHIRGLVHSCQKALNILKCLANKHWGSDGKTLLSLYRSLIRSKIDYGCIAYASASPSTLKQLDTLHNSALRLILGAFRTTPVDSLYCESGEAPLHSRRQILSLAYAAKVKSNPRHPVYKKISPSRSTTFNCRLYRKPLHVRIQQYLQEINLQLLDSEFARDS